MSSSAVSGRSRRIASNAALWIASTRTSDFARSDATRGRLEMTDISPITSPVPRTASVPAPSNDIDLSVDDHVGRVAGLSLGGDQVSLCEQVLLGDLGDRLQVLRREGREERRLAQEDDPLDEGDGGLGTGHGYSFQRVSRELRAGADPLVIVASQLLEDMRIPLADPGRLQERE